MKQDQEYQKDQERPSDFYEEADFSKPDFRFKPTGHHSYRQSGPYLICYSCEIQHAVWIGIENILVGFNKEDKPIVKSRKELGMK